MASQLVRNAALQANFPTQCARKVNSEASKVLVVPHYRSHHQSSANLQKSKLSLFGEGLAEVRTIPRTLSPRVPAGLRVSARASQGVSQKGQTNELVVREVQQPQSRVSFCDTLLACKTLVGVPRRSCWQNVGKISADKLINGDSLVDHQVGPLAQHKRREIIDTCSDL